MICIEISIAAFVYAIGFLFHGKLERVGGAYGVGNRKISFFYRQDAPMEHAILLNSRYTLRLHLAPSEPPVYSHEMAIVMCGSVGASYQGTG